MDIKVVDQFGKEVADPQVPVATEISPTEGGTDYDTALKTIGSVLGLETASSIQKYSSDLKTLVEYAQYNSEDKTTEGMKWAIRDLETKLGTPPLGEDRVKFVTRYCYLVNEERRLSVERKKFEKKL